MSTISVPQWRRSGIECVWEATDDSVTYDNTKYTYSLIVRYDEELCLWTAHAVINGKLIHTSEHPDRNDAQLGANAAYKRALLLRANTPHNKDIEI